MDTFRCGACEAFTTIGKSAQCASCKASLDVSGKPQEVDAAALQRAIALSPVPVFVDFWAPWCGPCVMSAPVVQAVAAMMAGEIMVLAVNTQDSPEAGEAHAIYAIPTFAVFHRGEELARQMGVMPRGELERWIRTVLMPAALETPA